MNQPLGYPVPQWAADRTPQGSGLTTGIPRGPMGVRPFQVNDAGATLILPDDPARGYLLIQNNSGGPVWIGLGSEPTDGQALILNPGVYWEPSFIPTNSIYIRGTLPLAQNGVALAITLTR